MRDQKAELLTVGLLQANEERPTLPAVVEGSWTRFRLRSIHLFGFVFWPLISGSLPRWPAAEPLTAQGPTEEPARPRGKDKLTPVCFRRTVYVTNNGMSPGTILGTPNLWWV